MLDSCIPFKESVANGLLHIEKQYANNNALALGETVYSYRDLFLLAKKLAAHLRGSNAPRCLIVSTRQVSDYVALLAALLAGKAYVFLNIKDNISQVVQNVFLAKTDLFITSDSSLFDINEITRHLSQELTVFKLNKDGRLVQYDSENYLSYLPPKTAYQYAYIMFTSGSSGAPKGVPISHRNLKTFIENISDRVKPIDSEKFSQINELTFDFSVYEIFCCWFSGSCLCVLPEQGFYGLDQYIQKHQITFWSSVPSVVSLLAQLNKLDEAAFQSIRYSFFCGEALTCDLARRWKKAAPNTVIDNLYGPTEATVAITGHRWDEKDSSEVVAIGWPFNGQGFYLVNEFGACVKAGEVGEIYLYGDQVAGAYWCNGDNARAAFSEFNGRRVYKTGDFALLDPVKGLFFKGRKDDQLKRCGYRIEKMEIENRLKAVLKTPSVAVIALKNKQTDQVNSLICFFSHSDESIASAKKACQKRLPAFFIPDVFIKLKQLPYNKNGKVNYQALQREEV